jgi:hypothetical protein
LALHLKSEDAVRVGGPMRMCAARNHVLSGRWLRCLLVR